MRKVIAVVVVIIIGYAIWSYISTHKQNEAPPSYIKDVVAYKEGSDGIYIYFVLADDYGAPTSSFGIVFITIYETKSEWSTWTKEYTEQRIPLYSNIEEPLTVTTSSFSNSIVGLGAFERKVLLCPVGRITYSEFNHQPEESSGVITVRFAPMFDETKSVLEGETTIFF